MKKRFNYVVLVAMVLIAMTSCRKPYQETLYESVNPNETAFVIPLEEGTKENQDKLKSEEYLQTKKVAAKRIIIPTQWHQTGRRSHIGDWIPSVRVIKVDRAPVTREWTGADGSGTSGNKKQDIEVESQESIGLGISVTATGMIPEEWTAKFLYLNSGRTLAEVMDLDIRAYIQQTLTTEFGSRKLALCQTQRADMYKVMVEGTKKYAESLGVKLTNIGAAGQFRYIDESIQVAINEKFTSAMKIEAADNAVKAANKFVQAAKAIEAQKTLDAELELIMSQVRRNDGMAKGFKTGKLQLPKVVSESIMEGLMGLSVD